MSLGWGSVWGRLHRVLLPYSPTWKISYDNQSQNTAIMLQGIVARLQGPSGPPTNLRAEVSVVFTIKNFLRPSSLPQNGLSVTAKSHPGLQTLWTKNLSLCFKIKPNYFSGIYFQFRRVSDTYYVFAVVVW